MKRKRLIQFLVCATLVTLLVLFPLVLVKDINSLSAFSKEYHEASIPNMDCRASLFPGVIICLPLIQFNEGTFTGTVLFQIEMSRVDMVGFIRGSEHTIGASWDDPCAEQMEDCGKRYIFNFNPPPVAGVYNLEILWLCNFNSSTSVYDQRRRLLYDAPVKFMQNLSSSDTQLVSLSRNLSVKGAVDELHLMKRVRRIFFVGDSHMRKLYEHSIFLITGKAKDFKGAVDLKFLHKSMVLIYLKMEGIYDNGRFGCIGRGKYTGRTKFGAHGMDASDVVLVSEAHWTIAFCEKDRYAAYRHYLPKFLDFFSVKNQERKVFITSPPWNPLYPGNNCKRRTNINLSWANQIGTSIALKRNWYIFDAWSLLIPLYNTTCDPAHFSCLVQNRNQKVIRGTDRIVVTKLWNYLINIS